ncbi:MAG: molybdate ABC transporter substrate-binding protein [Candidatus Kapaibacterium sp.]
MKTAVGSNAGNLVRSVKKRVVPLLNRRNAIVSVTLLSLLLIVSSCSREGAEGDSLGEEKKTELIVGGAASLKDAFEELGANFTAAHPNINILFSFAGSNVLARQVESGAPVDIIAVASEDILHGLDSAQLLLPGSRREFAKNQLCILLPEGSRLSIPDISHLGEIHLQHIAIASAGVPVRLYTEEAIRKSGLWEELIPRFVYGGNVRQVLSYVERGEVDCGFVYTSDAKTAPGTRIACVVDSSLHSPIRYPAAILRTSLHPEEASLFLNYLVSPEAQEVLHRYGFATPIKLKDH